MALLGALGVLLLVPAFGQLGDTLDKVGEKQVSLVPRDQIPPAPVLSPEDALKSFQLAPGLRIECVAAEPLIEDPVAAIFGPDGRLWIAEMRGYMPDFEGSTEDAPIGRIAVLTDDDGDGRFDRRSVFLDGLVLPRALALVGPGLLVGTPPLLRFYRDTDGDGVADASEIIASDYGVATDPKRPEIANPERAPNSLLWALDNWIYSAAYTKKFRYQGGRWETGVTTFRGQWGLSQDDFGRLYYNSNSDQLRADVIPSHYLGRNPNYPKAAGTNVLVPANQLVWPARVTPGTNRAYRPETMRDGRLKEFTAACAPWIYRGDALPPEYYGNAFVCDPAANLVKRNLVTAAAGTVSSREAYDRREFLASTDERFRPVNFTTGPEGALYLVDLHKGVIEHRISLTTYLRKQAEERGLDRPLHLGRIYRILPAEGAAPKAVRLDRLTAAELVGELSQRNSWRRETAQRLLVEKNDPTVTPALRQLALTGTSPLGRMHALWTLEGLDLIDVATATRALQDSETVVRTAAIRICEPLLQGRERAAVVSALLGLATDAAPEVQLQLALTLGAVREPAVDLALARLGRTATANKFLRDAICSGLHGRELAVLESLVAEPSSPPDDPAANALLHDLALGVMNSRDAAAIERLLTITNAVPRSEAARRTALLAGAVSASLVSAARPVKFAQESAALAALSQTVAGPDRVHLAKLHPLLVWPRKPGVVVPYQPPALTAAEQARFEAGRALYAGTCAPCHQPHGRGLEGLAPPLANSEWVNGSAERLVRIALHGVRGRIKVDGRIYTLEMPPWGALRDEDLSAVLTYIRREWDNTGSPVTTEFVAAARAATKTRQEAWTEPELLKIP